MQRIFKTCVLGAMGYMNYIDMNGDPQGNFTLVARKFNAERQKYGLYPVGTFALNHNDKKLPVRFQILSSL